MWLTGKVLGCSVYRMEFQNRTVPFHTSLVVIMLNGFRPVLTDYFKIKVKENTSSYLDSLLHQ